MSDNKTNNGGFLLIVDDDRGTSELEAQRLEPLGLEIRRASAPIETIDILKSSTPELMLLDYSLPGMTALELVARLKNNSITVPPFIMVTGRGDEAVAVKSMQAGALDYIVKDGTFLENILSTARKALDTAALQFKLKNTEVALLKNLRLYTFLAQVNQAAVAQKNKNKLFDQICSIAVNSGGFKMAWIGVPDSDTGRIIPVCSAGFTDGYLDAVKITQSEGPNSKGPTGTAVRTGCISWVQDISTDPQVAPWREQALKKGYRSSAAIPFNENGRTVAVLNLYAAETGFFTEEEQKLLSEIQGDISLALGAIALEEKRAAAEAALQRTASQLTHIMDANPVMLFTLRKKSGKTIFEWVSGNVQAVTGYSPEEVLARNWWKENIHPDYVESSSADMQKVMQEGAQTRDFRFRKKSGQYFWVHSQLRVASAETGEIAGSWTDITPLKESQLRFQELFENVPIGYQSLDADGRLLAVNSTWCATFGYSKDEVLGHDFTEFLLPECKEMFTGNFRRFKAAGQTKGLELEIKNKDGATRHIVLNGQVGYNPDGSFRQTHCVFSDITETWKSREQMDLLSQAVRSSFNEVYIYDAESLRFLFVNYGAVKNLGYAPEELDNMTPFDLKHNFTEALYRSMLAPLLSGQKNQLIFESEHTRKDGSVYPVEVRLQLVETGKKRVFLSVICDITEKKNSEKIIAEMAAMQRVESLGLLAGGIAHDFNNMLTGIMANISLLESRCGGNQENAEILRETMEAANNAQSLTANLLTFSKGGKPLKKEFSLETALKEIFNLSTAGTNCACEMEVLENLWSVEGDENQLKQAVNNILMNGLQSMPSGGKLRLQARNFGRGTPPPETLAPGDYVRITVSDTGIGMPENYLAHVFDPYFTTKARGRGLGLFMAWSVVKNHGGHIAVSSTPGKGCSFDIYLPATGRSLQMEEEAKKAIAHGSGRILVLEDEEIVSHALRRMLTDLGYTCEIVTDGKDAVRRYTEEEKKGKPFAAVIMDLTIPGGYGGKPAVLELRKTAPGARVIVSSGYSDDGVMSDFKANGFDAVLPKPYKFEELAETLSRLLKK